MDAVSYSLAAKQAQRIEKFIENPDSISGLVTQPSVIASGESVAIPAGRQTVVGELDVQGTLDIQGELFVASGGSLSQTTMKTEVIENSVNASNPVEFSVAPTAPTPTTDYQVANKEYVDTKVSKVTSTDNAIVRFDGTTGQVQNSTVVIDDNGSIKVNSADPVVAGESYSVYNEDYGTSTWLLKENWIEIEWSAGVPTTEPAVTLYNLLSDIQVGSTFTIGNINSSYTVASVEQKGGTIFPAYGVVRITFTTTHGYNTWFIAGTLLFFTTRDTVGYSVNVAGTVNAKNVISNNAFFVNPNTITSSYSIPVGSNAMTAGPITVANGVSIVVPDGSSWTIV